MYVPFAVVYARLESVTARAEARVRRGPSELLRAGVIARVSAEAEMQLELLRESPHAVPSRRLDEATAARKPVLRW
jgi:hypothetical protein